MKREDVSPRARELWEELHQVIKNEEAWEIIQRHLDQERAEVALMWQNLTLTYVGPGNALDPLHHL